MSLHELPPGAGCDPAGHAIDMNFAIKMMKFVFQMMKFVFQMMITVPAGHGSQLTPAFENLPALRQAASQKSPRKSCCGEGCAAYACLAGSPHNRSVVHNSSFVIQNPPFLMKNPSFFGDYLVGGGSLPYHGGATGRPKINIFSIEESSFSIEESSFVYRNARQTGRSIHAHL